MGGLDTDTRRTREGWHRDRLLGEAPSRAASGARGTSTLPGQPGRSEQAASSAASPLAGRSWGKVVRRGDPVLGSGSGCDEGHAAVVVAVVVVVGWDVVVVIRGKPGLRGG